MPPQSMPARQAATLSSDVLSPTSVAAATASSTHTSAGSEPASEQGKIIIPAVIASVIVTVVLIGAILISIRRSFKPARTRAINSSRASTSTTSRSPTVVEGAAAQSPSSSQVKPWYKRFAKIFYRTDIYGSGAGFSTSSRTALQPSRNAPGSETSVTAQGTTTTGEGNRGTNTSQGRDRRRRRDGVRRTDSGHSVKTLPEYRTALGEDELMLFKGDSTLSLRDISINIPEEETDEASEPRELRRHSTNEVVVDLSQSPEAHHDHHQHREDDEANSVPLLSSPRLGAQHDSANAVTDNEADPSSQPTRRESSRSARSVAENLSSSIRRSMRLSGAREGEQRGSDLERRSMSNADGNEMTELRHRDEHEADATEELRTEGNQHSLEPQADTPAYSSLYPQLPPAIRLEGQSEPEIAPTSNNSSRTRAFRSLFRRGGGGGGTAPTASSAHQASTLLGAPSSISQERVSEESFQQHTRYSSSTSITSNLTPSELGADSSNLSLRLQPSRGSMTQGRASTSSRHRSGSFGRLLHLNNSSASFETDPSALTPSPGQTADGRRISSPVQGSLIRMQYEAPARGLTESQMSFLASADSLGRFGVPMHSPMRATAAGAEGNGTTTEPPVYEGANAGGGDSNNDAEQNQANAILSSSAANMGAARPAPLLTPAEVVARAERSQQQELGGRQSATLPFTSADSAARREIGSRADTNDTTSGTATT